MSRTCVVLFLACCVICGQAAASGRPRVVPPLHTSGHQILDARGQRVRLTSVNWYGIDQKEYVVGGLVHAPLRAIIGQIKAIGVNSVRLPWANETVEHNPL